MTHEEFESLAALDAVGAATPDEERGLRAHLDSCADCATVRDEMFDAAAFFARDLAPVTPPADVRDRIFTAIDMDDDADDADEANVVRPAFNNRRWLTAAAVVFLALWCWRELGIRAAREHVRSQESEIARLQEENALVTQQRDKLSAEMQSIASAGTRTIALTGQEVAPSASAKVFLEPDKRRAVVFFYNMPPNAGDKSYQLWILRADQPNPQSAGTFDAPNGNATVTVDNLPVATEIKGLAVTLEPKGGVEQPTNTRFFVSGNV